jgi:hypothetical protein
VGAVIAIAVIEPGEQAEAILACLSERLGGIDLVDVREYQAELQGVDIASATETVTKAARECDPNWHRYLAIAAPPGPG